MLRAMLYWGLVLVVFLFCLWFSFIIGVRMEHAYHQNDIPFEMLPEICPNDWGGKILEIEPEEVPERL